MVLGVLFDSTLDSVDKRLGLTQALTKEGFKFFSGNGNVGFIFYFLLVLLLAKQGNILEKNGGK